MAFGTDQDRRDGVVNDEADEAQHKDDGHDRDRQWQNNVPKGLPRCRAINCGGLVQRGVDTVEIAIDCLNVQGDTAEVDQHERNMGIEAKEGADLP